MKVETVHGTMDIHIGAQYTEVYGHLLFPTLLIIWEVISDPKVEIHPDGSKFISWMSRNTITGKETIMGISDRDIHYSSHIYPIDHPKIKRLIASHPQLCQGISGLKKVVAANIVETTIERNAITTKTSKT